MSSSGYQSNIVERAKTNISTLEKKFLDFDLKSIQSSAAKKSLIDHKQTFEEMKQLSSKERDYENLKIKNDNSKAYLQEVITKNASASQDIEKKSADIESRRQDHLMLFKVAFETIMRRMNEYEKDCEKKGMKIEKHAHLQQVAEEEQDKILALNAEIMQIEKNIKDYQNQYKEIVNQELGELTDQKEYQKQKLEEYKKKTKELNDAIDDFKKRFIMQSRQMHSNKDRQKQLEKEIFRVVEQKNYLEKENQELTKQRENQILIYQNLVEEVAGFKKENQEATDRKKTLEDFIMKNLK